MTTITGADGTLVLWLRRLVAERDLRVQAPDGDPRADALRVLVAAVAGEFAQYLSLLPI